MRSVKVVEDKYILTNEVTHMTEIIAEEWYMISHWMRENPDIYFVDSSVRDKTCISIEPKRNRINELRKPL